MKTLLGINPTLVKHPQLMVGTVSALLGLPTMAQVAAQC